MTVKARATWATVALFSAFLEVGAAEPPLDFSRDIRPILSENCFHCHGPDAADRKAKLRLDDRESATRTRNDFTPIAPGRPDESELVARVLSKDPDEQMPPPDSHRALTVEQIARLRRWIAEGAPYSAHWAYVPPIKLALPVLAGSDPGLSPIDAWVRARLAPEGLVPGRKAAPATWLRRASFDLTGLPPTPAESAAFVEDVAGRGESAYAAVADRLLASPAYGERQALEWLDTARYADSHGFNNDGIRTMWRWRDWVIDAFNADLPYDRFITEQLAGDLLPRPTLEQRIATGFGRNHVINSEGGIIEEEYRFEYVADRVRTASTAWLGLTLECARCHDHKFDPIAQRDYYRFFAFFNNVPEHGEDGRRANGVPMIPAPTAAQQAEAAAQRTELAALDRILTAAASAPDRSVLAARVTAARSLVAALPSTALLEPSPGVSGIAGRAWRPAADAPTRLAGKLFSFGAPEGFTLAFWLNPARDNPADTPLFSTLNHLGDRADAQWGKGREVRLVGGEIELRLSDRLPVYAIVLRTTGACLVPGEWRHVAISYAGGRRAANVRVFIDGVESEVDVRYDGLHGSQPEAEILVGSDNAPDGARWRGALDDARAFPRPLTSEEVRALFESAALDVADPAPTPRTAGWLRTAALADMPATRDAVVRRRALWDEHVALRRTYPTTMVMAELATPRPAHLLRRGDYASPGEEVSPGALETLLAPWPEGAPRNRLGLARWLTQPGHPLTARVVVNRLWAQFFGTGLVKTLEDFGNQGESPSHPELLDWLARDFVEGGWSVKRMLRQIVLSATYRQDSAMTAKAFARDPENRLLARGPRVRLPAELIRDQALALSGLLRPRIGGPSVYPYQPAKLYDGVVVGTEYPGSRWALSTGDDLYRRSLYTFWKRTVPHPAMRVFDAPDREVCTVRRARTNTPLQAFVLWNEPGQVEAARELGARLLRDPAPDASARLAGVFAAATGRSPGPDELRVLLATQQLLRADYAAHPADAAALLAIGAQPADSALPAADLAAATAVASMILSLDETITKN